MSTLSTTSKLAAALALVACLVAAPGPARAEATKTPVLFDALLIRPLGAVALVVSTTAVAAMTPFIVIWPPEGRLERVYDRYVVRPAEFVFVDPLGSH